MALLHVNIVAELHQTWWSSTSEYFIFAQQQLHFPLIVTKPLFILYFTVFMCQMEFS